MELHSSPTACKKLWNILRVAFLMMRKGSMSKRKLIMDMNLMMQRGKVLLGKSLAFHHPHSSGAAASTPRSFGLHEYEFSCASSPNPTSFRANYSKRKHSYFPCMGASAVDERPNKAPAGPLDVVLVPRIEYSPARSSSCAAAAAAALAATAGDLVPGDQRCTPIVRSPLAEEEGDDGVGGEVDSRAEEFIKRFYQQLHALGQIALKEQYQEMLARGT